MLYIKEQTTSNEIQKKSRMISTQCVLIELPFSRQIFIAIPNNHSQRHCFRKEPCVNRLREREKNQLFLALTKNQSLYKIDCGESLYVYISNVE